jgi:hypothetical protein
LKIYVAAKFEDRGRAQEVMAQLERCHHEITYNWTNQEQNSAEQALRDLRGVIDADALVFIAERDLAYCGSLVEVGIAMCENMPIYVLGHACDDCIFFQLPNVYRGIDELLEMRCLT